MSGVVHESKPESLASDLCLEHGCPLTLICVNCGPGSYICELCAISAQHKSHETIALRQEIEQIMEQFNSKFNVFEQRYTMLEESKICEYRN